MKRAGLLVALAALLVNAPRLMLIYLRVDGLALPASAEGAMLGLTGVATGIVLTGGGMYIAHVLAQSHAASGFLRGFLVACWLLLLAFSVMLIAPALVAGIRATTMVNVLNTARWQWIWSVTAVAAVEILAAGAMAAHALISEPTPQQSKRSKSKPSAFGLLADAAVQRLVAGIELQQSVGTKPEPPSKAVARSPSTKPAQSYACPYCDYEGTSHQGLNAHKRFCDGWQNGQRDEPVPNEV